MSDLHSAAATFTLHRLWSHLHLIDLVKPPAATASRLNTADELWSLFIQWFEQGRRFF